MDHWINLVRIYFTYYLSFFTVTRSKHCQWPEWFIYKWPVIQFTASSRLFSRGDFSQGWNKYTSKILSPPYCFELRHSKSIRKQQHKRRGKSPKGWRLRCCDFTPGNWGRASWSGTTGRVSGAAPGEQWPLLCRLPRGNQICLCFPWCHFGG